MGITRFGIPKDLVLWLRDRTGARTLIETGTNEGVSARWAAGEFDRVITIEGYEPLFVKLKSRQDWPANIEFLFGDSAVLLPSIVARLQGPAIFWLDAHWCGTETFGAGNECPVSAEIDAVNSATESHVILVDDARLFLAPPPPPHVASHWPDIAALCRSLMSVSGGRYLSVLDDVLIAVPAALRDPMIEYLREQMVKSAQLHDRPGLRARVRRRIRSLLGS